MSDPALVLRRAQSRKRGERQHDDFDVFDGERDVGRIYLVHPDGRTETWFWGVSFRVTKRKSYGYAVSLEEAKAEFRRGARTLTGPEPDEDGDPVGRVCIAVARRGHKTAQLENHYGDIGRDAVRQRAIDDAIRQLFRWRKDHPLARTSAQNSRFRRSREDRAFLKTTAFSPAHQSDAGFPRSAR